jgi:hypothetical protein
MIENKWLVILFVMQADADSRTMQLVEQLTMLLAKQQALNASGAGGGIDGAALARKVASLEEELNRMTQHRLEHLERLQQQQFQLQTELIKIQGRGGHSGDGTAYIARRGDGVDLDREDNIRTLFDTPAPRRAVPQPSVRDQKTKNSELSHFNVTLNCLSTGRFIHENKYFHCSVRFMVLLRMVNFG